MALVIIIRHVVIRVIRPEAQDLASALLSQCPDHGVELISLQAFLLRTQHYTCSTLERAWAS